MDRSIVYEVGDIVKLKKPHPCGSQEWEIMRVGADFRLKCLGCGHQIMVERKLVEKNTRGLRKPGDQPVKQKRQKKSKKKKHEKSRKKSLILAELSVIIIFRDTSFLAPELKAGARDQKEVNTMNKYELAVVLSAKLEDDERAAAIEKVQGYITRFGGTVTNVDEWGKKRLAYEIQKMKEGYYYFVHFDAEATVPAEIEQRMRIMDNVLRYLCVKQEA